MIKIMFVCHGNICRSPMAEFVMKDLVKQDNLENFIDVNSSATSFEEIGNPVHRGTKSKLSLHGISTKGKFAEKLLKSDYDKYDFFIGMDNENIRNMMFLFDNDPKNKIHKLLDFANDSSDIADPWYTGNFDETFDDVMKGCTNLLEYIKENLL